MDLFQAGVGIGMPAGCTPIFYTLFGSPTRNMHLYVVVEKCHAIFDLNWEKAGYVKHASSLWMLPSLDTWDVKDLNKDCQDVYNIQSHVSSEDTAKTRPEKWCIAITR